MTQKHADGETVKVLDAEHGKWGTYKHIIAEQCPDCGCNRAIHTGQTVPGVARVECPACGHTFQ